MAFALTPVETRVLGVLIEKQLSTPEYYPMTLNALVNACNQKTNRDPVMELDEDSVLEGLDGLRSQRLVWQVRTQGSRVSKYEHNMKDVAEFSNHELGILCELLLRGPQTTGELRTRTARLAEFNGLAAVEHTLNKLMAHEKGPFAVKLSREPGRKESRYAHLFGPPPQVESIGAPVYVPVAAGASEGAEDRLEQLEQKMESLQAELAEVKQVFVEFKKQFE